MINGQHAEVLFAPATFRAYCRQPFPYPITEGLPLSGSVYNRFSQAYLRLLIGGNSTKRPFRLPLDIATRLEKWI